MNILLALITSIVLVIHSIEDILRLHINIIILFTGAIALIFIQLCMACKDPVDIIVSCIPGGCIWLISRFMNRHIGSADGYIFFLTGISTGLWVNVSIIICSFILSSLFCLFGLAIRKLKKTQQIPFVPFIFTGYIINMIFLNIRI